MGACFSADANGARAARQPLSPAEPSDCKILCADAPASSARGGPHPPRAPADVQRSAEEARAAAEAFAAEALMQVRTVTARGDACACSGPARDRSQ